MLTTKQPQAREAVPDPVAPWTKEYKRGFNCVVFRNTETDAMAVSLAEVAELDLLASIPGATMQKLGAVCRAESAVRVLFSRGSWLF